MTFSMISIVILNDFNAQENVLAFYLIKLPEFLSIWKLRFINTNMNIPAIVVMAILLQTLFIVAVIVLLSGSIRTYSM